MVEEAAARGGDSIPPWAEALLRCPETGERLRRVEGAIPVLFPMRVAAPDVYWDRRALAWGRIGPPWRPTAEVVQITADMAGPMAGRQVLQLGVTPEIAAIPRQGGARLLAVDRSLPMIEALWRGGDPGAVALCADWRTLPLAEGCADLILADGVVAVLPIDDIGVVAKELHRVARPDAALVTRVFSRPEVAEAPAEILASLARGAYASVEVFRMRLVAALHGAGEGVAVDAVWRAFHEAVPDPTVLATALGWSPDAFRVLEAGRGAQATLRLPRAGDLGALLLPHFRLEEEQVSDPDPPGWCRVLRYRRI